MEMCTVIRFTDLGSQLEIHLNKGLNAILIPKNLYIDFLQEGFIEGKIQLEGKGKLNSGKLSWNKDHVIINIELEGLSSSVTVNNTAKFMTHLELASKRWNTLIDKDINHLSSDS